MNSKELVEFYNLNGLTPLLKKLKDLGFSRISLGEYTDVFKRVSDNYVIKICCRGDNTLPRINTKEYNRIKPFFVGYLDISFDSKVASQPYVKDYFELDSSEKRLLKSFIQKIKGDFDIHVGNVGLLNNNLVVFDF